MAKIGITTGTPNQGGGSTLLQGAIAINNNFNEIYNAIGNGTTVSDIQLNISSASGVGTLSYSNRTLTYTPPDLSSYITGVGTISSHTDVEVTSPQVGQVLKWNGSNWINNTDNSTINFSGNIFNGGTTNGIVTSVTLGNNLFLSINQSTATIDSGILRSSGVNTTSSIGIGSTALISISSPKTYVLYSIQTSHPSWVTLYTDSTSRNNDLTRSETQDPLPGSGVIAEVITTSGNLTQLITPGTIGFNNDFPTNFVTYAKIVNKHSSEVGISVTMNYLKLEG